MTGKPMKADAASGLDGLLGRVRSDGSATPKPIKQKARASSFDTHPLYRSMLAQREAGEAMGIASPYYQQHDSRSGAKAIISGREVINFSSYDYLALNGHPEILKKVTEAALEFGTSVSASRISAGERRVHRALEKQMAELYRMDDAIAFVSGHAAGVSTLATLFGPRDLIVYDELIHNCVLVGAQLSGATRRPFKHNDLRHLNEILERERGRFDRALIVSEGIFSMDGDGPDLKALTELKLKHDCVLMIDDAHGLGVLGEAGRGIFEQQNFDPRGVDLWMGTFSKALVSCGGYIAGGAMAIDILKHFAPGFVYSVGMTALSAVSASAALSIMLSEPQRVKRLQDNSQRFFHRAREAGLNLGSAWGYGIIPVIVGDQVKALLLANRLLQAGVNAFPILPPGVPDGSSRLRFFITEGHTDAEIDMAVDLVTTEVKKLGLI